MAMFSFVDENFDFAHKIDKVRKPTEEYHKHFHLFNEILFLVHGDISFTVETETRHLLEGDIVIVPSGAYHFATVNLLVEYERYVLKFPDSYLPAFVKKKLETGSVFFHGNKKYETTFNSFDTYFTEYDKDELHVMFAAELLKLVTQLCHESAQRTERNDDFVTQIQEYIESNLKENITFEMLTKEFHYSKSFICSEFKKKMRISLMKYIREKKIIAAHQMILNGAKKKEAAETYGFETYSTFYRAYKNLLDVKINED